MLKYLFLFLPLYGYAQLQPGQYRRQDSSTFFKIDASISAKARKVITEPVSGSPKYAFRSHFSYTFFTDDKVVDSGETPFKTIWARYYWKNDTLHVVGAPEELAGGGFHVVIIRGANFFYHFNCGRTRSRFKKSPQDRVRLCIEVPCRFSKLILSNIPDDTRDAFIYGYVEFRSGDYYYQNRFRTDRLRENMKFYFRAYNYDFLDRKVL